MSRKFVSERERREEAELSGEGGRFQLGRQKKAKKAKSGNNLTSVSLLMVQAMMQMIAFLQVCVSFSC